MKYFKGSLDVWGISPGSFHLLRVTVCVHGEGEDAGVDAGLVPRPHLGPGEPARRGDGWLGETSQE